MPKPWLYSDEVPGSLWSADTTEALPDDFVIREVLEVDADDPAAVESFQLQWGGLVDIHDATEEADLLRQLQWMARTFIGWAESGGTNDHDAPFEWFKHLKRALEAFPMFPVMRIAGQQFTGEAPTASLYSVSMLQLAQIASEDRHVHRCANETCGRPFTRHRSERRQYGSTTAHASGLKYCSQSCAKAQSERERRRRRRDEQKGGTR
jgi:hypothetical protein